jgi:probable F420-dependent oxidoreductase
MQFWLSLIFEQPDSLVEHARAAEEFGFSGVALQDHVVVKVGDRVPHPSGYPLQPDEIFVDPFCAFSAMASVTTHLRFLNSVYVVPLRDPFSLAKQAGSLAVLSNDRYTLGTGVGWLRDEFEIMGSDFDSRGRRMDEILAILRDFWDDGYAEYHGEFFDFPNSAMFPVPQQPIPILIGGHSLKAARRAARFDGYMPMRSLDEETRREFAEIDAVRKAEGLEGPFERLIGAEVSNPGDVRKLEEADGITSILVTPWKLSDYDTSLDQKRRLIENFASDVIARM